MKRFIIFVLLTTFFSITTTFAKQEQDKTYQQLKILLDVLNYTKENYVEEVDIEKLINSAAKGITRSLDAFSQFMEPDDFKELKVETEGQFGGLGIRIAIRDEWLTVITPLPGTPAYKIGILPGDKIVKIENESTQGITVTDAVKKLRGTPGTKVNITIVREGVKEPIDYTITRDIIKIEAVKFKTELKDGIGYIALYEFNSNSYSEMVDSLNELKKRGMTSLVLDLRNNPGGLLNQAVDISKLFIGDNKLIVYTEGRNAPRKDYRADEKALFADIPMVTLVNGGSASGAEILAGALQDNKRSLIIGSQTFGKASVQSVLNLDKGYGLKITTAKYYTPSGRSIQREEKSSVKGSTETYTGGIIPDIIINVPKEIEAKLYQQREEIYFSGKEPVSAVKKEDQVEDVVLNRAYEILKAINIYSQYNRK